MGARDLHNHTHHIEHGHDHGHGHGHAGHSHVPADFGRAFAIGIVLNTAFVIVEATYGFLSGSMALVADAGHNLSDVLALLVAWGASIAAKRAPTTRFTYGYKSSTILAALANAALLLIAIGAIFYETLHRMTDPQPIEGMTVVIVASIGIAINAFTALLFMKGSKDDLNIRGAYLHMAADALVSAGVVLAGLAIIWTGALWIDPAVSLIIVAVIAWGTWGLLKDSVKMGLLGVPEGISEADVRTYLSGLAGVNEVHELHIWPMSTTETALTAHLVMPAGHPGDVFLHDIARQLNHHHQINHATIQIEQSRECAQHGSACFGADAT
ncbi:cation diffusion facilitator family transporter [Pontixanthobacter aestiaquae]|uniref:Cation diffusion facilitator family transporter n=1 Tax=Pontixanthobacter aestiaquae TaxID=1509367 RepID=A0A844Z2E2_9SPHN|nr:cation diffusion facilitator family transporter [Pontixanthobacter aestiaquae]MDN3646137.1 cation diffusion facilitator family transporter [Pontixanthobacter aestiaquae]MXO82871.1 cation diffusion facilitator family transporter [Pontixanthobacter aestiaquae]